jgi:hypothetical protein
VIGNTVDPRCGLFAGGKFAEGQFVALEGVLVGMVDGFGRGSLRIAVRRELFGACAMT